MGTADFEEMMRVRAASIQRVDEVIKRVMANIERTRKFIEEHSPPEKREEPTK